MENLTTVVEELAQATRHNEKTVGCVTTTDIAKMYNMSTKDMVSFLRDRHAVIIITSSTAPADAGSVTRGHISRKAPA